MLLYPWDAGVDSGVSYESPDTPTDPPQPIARITSQQPNDEGPFHIIYVNTQSQCPMLFSLHPLGAICMFCIDGWIAL